MISMADQPSKPLVVETSIFFKYRKLFLVDTTSWVMGVQAINCLLSAKNNRDAPTEVENLLPSYCSIRALWLAECFVIWLLTSLTPKSSPPFCFEQNTPPPYLAGIIISIRSPFKPANMADSSKMPIKEENPDVPTNAKAFIPLGAFSLILLPCIN